MSLNPGSRLGPYEILAPLGAGGMGEVYSARDTRLERTVAVKVLPGHLSSDPTLRQRFEREARAVSALNHPSICILHDIGSQEGVDYLVMEHLDGETLAARLTRGALPAEEALRVGVQIADGLDKAHRKGVIHRDLKPGNIMLTRAGAKLLDFGLAKSLDSAAPASGASRAATAPGLSPSGPSTPTAIPTALSPLTAAGTIVGTFQYMAPEQLEGGEADVRSDIFAFGVVLYEMLAGRRAFEGRTQASLAAAVLKEQPRSLTELQPATPPALARLVATCLAKEPDERWQTMADVLLQLRWIAEGGSLAGVPAPVASRRRSREMLAWGVAAVALVSATAFGLVTFRLSTREEPILRASINAPPGIEYNIAGIQPGPAALSPDGRRLAFAGRDAGGAVQLWIRALDAGEAQMLKGTEGASYPFWSPDSRSIGFFAGGQLKRIDTVGGPAIVLGDAPTGKGGTWSPEGTILFAPAFNSPIHRISSSGGESVPVTELDDERGENSHRSPQFLPDGRHFIYFARAPRGTASGGSAIRVGEIGKEGTEVLMPATFHATFASGHLLYVQESTLLARPFDPDRLEFTGEPLPLASEVGGIAGASRGLYSASGNGVLVYQQGGADAAGRLAWFSATGEELAPLGDPAEYQDQIGLSPDGRQAAVVLPDVGTGTSDIWVYDVARQVRSRFTFDLGAEITPVWSPDGGQIVFASDKEGRHFGLFLQDVGAATPSRTLLVTEVDAFPEDWSPDGQLAFLRVGGDIESTGGVDVWLIPAAGGGEPRPFLQSRFVESDVAFSPDGRWVSYSSNESGKFEVYVVPWPGPGGKWQISTQGGTESAWSRDSRTLYYTDLNGVQTAVALTARGESLDVGPPQRLFQDRRVLAWTAPAPDDRFLVLLGDETETSTELWLVVNWPGSLR